MGFAIAGEAAARGHVVTLISGPVELGDPPRVRVVRVVSAAEMFEASVKSFAECNAAVMAAAVSDYRPKERFSAKLAKQDQSRSLELEATPDICAHLGAQKGARVVVGFAMEDHDHRAHAEAKLQRKHCDAIVMNDLANLGAEGAEVRFLLADGGWQPSISGNKAEIARAIVGLVERLYRPTAPQDFFVG